MSSDRKIEKSDQTLYSDPIREMALVAWLQIEKHGDDKEIFDKLFSAIS